MNKPYPSLQTGIGVDTRLYACSQVYQKHRLVSVVLFTCSFRAYVDSRPSTLCVYIHCEPKNTPKCFCYLFYKTRPILIKFDIHIFSD